MLSGFQFGLFGSVLIGFFELPSISSLVVPVALVLGVLLIAWDVLKALLSAVGGKLKSIVPGISTRISQPAHSTTSSRVALWEQLYEACDPEHGACPKARELLTEVFRHLAPYHPEAK